MKIEQKIVTSLWFDDNAEEAVAFYTSIFPDSRVLRVQNYTEAGPGTPGTVLSVAFVLAGQEFMAINGGPHFTFSEAISLAVKCADQAEIDRLWDALLAGGGREQQCGWLKDRFGLSWQVVPESLDGMLNNADTARAARVMRAVLSMVKLDVAAIQRAHDGG
ncbi:MAG: VOC family protein [Azospirillaceae bacterium]